MKQGTPITDKLVQIIEGGHEYCPQDVLLPHARNLERQLREQKIYTEHFNQMFKKYQNRSVDLERQLSQTKQNEAALVEAINKIAPWLSASITYGDPCREYVAACNKIFELDRK